MFGIIVLTLFIPRSVFAREIIPVTLPDGAGVYDKDDGPRRETSLEKLASLQPVFRD